MPIVPTTWSLYLRTTNKFSEAREIYQAYESKPMMAHSWQRESLKIEVNRLSNQARKAKKESENLFKEDRSNQMAQNICLISNMNFLDTENKHIEKEIEQNLLTSFDLEVNCLCKDYSSKNSCRKYILFKDIFIFFCEGLPLVEMCQALQKSWINYLNIITRYFYGIHLCLEECLRIVKQEKDKLEALNL